MATNAEEVQRALERARQANDQEAVDVLEGHLQTLQPDQTAEPVIEQPAEVEGALPTNDSPTGEGLSGPALSTEQRKNRITELAYERDRALIASQDISQAERNQFMKDNTDWEYGHGMVDTMGRQLVRDDETGKLRWSAMSLEDMERVKGRKKTKSLYESAPAALASGVVRQVGQRVTSKDEAIESRRNVQSFIWNSLPKAEQRRMREELSRRYDINLADVTDEEIAKIPALQFKQVMEMNPENETLIADMMGDEEVVVRGERWKRIGNRVINLFDPYGHKMGEKMNVFGAQAGQGDIMGSGAYVGPDGQPLEYGEKRAPIYPGASQELGEWLYEAKRDQYEFGKGLYEYLIRPMLTSEDGKLPGERVTDAAQRITDTVYTEGQKRSVEKPFFPEDMTLKDALNPDFWTDPNTKMPWNDWDGFALTFLQTTPQIIEGVAAARMGGRGAATAVTKQMAGRTVKEIERARRNWGRAGGAITGGSAEGGMIYDEVASEVRETLHQVPMEKFREDPVFQQMMDTGAYTEEEAKQLLIHDASRVAGWTGFWVAGIGAGSPMMAFFGSRGAGRVGGKTTAKDVITGALGEPMQEGTQELIEGEISDMAIRRIDPENPIFDMPNRRLERFGSGAFIAAPSAVGALASVAPKTPAGYKKEDMKAAEATMSFMDAANARFKFEMSLDEPDAVEAGRVDPNKRLDQLKKLEQLQEAEAEALLKAEPDMRAHFEANPSQTSKAELKMLNALKMKANATLTDIAVARSRRQTATEMVEEQEKILRDRAKLQDRVAADVVSLEDVERQLGSIEAVQNNEPVTEEDYAELLKEGYGRWTNKNKDKFVITPKGKRAMNLLNQQKQALTNKLGVGYAGPERRDPVNQTKRSVVESAGPVEREQMLMTDPLTGVQNRRAYNERVENIDDKEAEAVTKQPGAQEFVAAVDVDSLGWVNDKMSHVAGDQLLVSVADAIGSQKGVEIYRTGGDEFLVTGSSEQALEQALQRAARELETTPVAFGNEEVVPSITWGKGTTYQEADTESVQRKQERIQRGQIAGKGKKPSTWRWRTQQTLFQFDPLQDMKQKLADIDQALEEGWVPEERVEHAKAMKQFLEIAVKVSDPAESKVSVPEKFAEVVHNATLGIPADYKGKRLSLKYTSAAIKAIEEKFNDGQRIKPRFIARVLDKAGVKMHRTNLHMLRYGEMETQASKRAKVSDFNAVLKAYEALLSEGGLLLQRNMETLPTKWRQIEKIARRGDNVEILTPTGALVGVVTKVKKGKKPRVTVNVNGREYRFNPTKNHLITFATDAADVAYLTDQPQFADPLYGPLPQIIQDVQIGHIGRQGDWYADLFIEPQMQQELPWWNDEYAEWDPVVPFIYKAREATEEEMVEAEAVKDKILGDYKNLPPITLVRSTEHLEQVNPDLVRQLRAHPGGTLSGVRGFFDEINPENGVVVLVQNVPKYGGGFEANLSETILHEVIGHYGIRGMFGNEAEMRAELSKIVDAFPHVASLTKGKVPRAPGSTDAEYKQLVGEEMIAYITGEMLAGTITLTKPQRNVIQRFFDWVRSWIARTGWGRRFNMKDPSADSKYGFWTDEKVQQLIARAQDYVRNGRDFQFEYIDGRYVRLMREADIFRLASIDAINNATKKLSRRERNQLQSKYPEGQAVPKEVPLFPEVGSPNVFKQAMQMVGPGNGKLNLVSNLELKLSNLSETSDFNFFRDSTYNDIKELSGTIATDPNSDVEQTWYKEVMPIGLAQEYESLLEIAANPADYVRPDDRTQLVKDADLRILEIQNMRLDQKKSQLTKDHLRAYLTSEKVITVEAIAETGHPTLTYEAATKLILGEDHSLDPNDISEEEAQQIRDEIEMTKNRGYDVGFDDEYGVWNDRKIGGSYSGSTPEGANFADDYRVVFIRQYGGGVAVGRTGHFSSEEGVLVHVRSGLAEVLPVEGENFPIAMRKEMEGKLLSLIEMQTDWLQSLRKKYRSEAEETQGSMTKKFNTQAIRAANVQLAQNFNGHVMEFMNETLKPIANLPKGSLSSDFKEYVREAYGTEDFEHGLTKEQQDDAYKTFRNSKVLDLVRKLERVRNDVTEYTAPPADVESGLREEVPGSLDARYFDKLDRYAVKTVASMIASDIEQLTMRLHQLVDQQSPLDFIQFIRDDMNRPLPYLTEYMSSPNSRGADMRLPFAQVELSKVMHPLLDALNVPRERIAGLLKEHNETNSRMFKLPMEAFKDMVRATGYAATDAKIGSFLQDMFKASSLTGGGVNTDHLSVMPMISPSGDSVDITVSGSAQHVADFNLQMKRVMNRYITRTLPDKWESKRESDVLQSQRELNIVRNQNRLDPESVEWDQMEAEYDIEDHDIEERDDVLDGYDVTSYDEFEEEEINSELDSVAEHYVEYDLIWEEQTEFHRDSEEYRALIVVDEDGDADTQDAEDWLRRERENYTQNLRDEDWVYDQARDAIRDRFYNDPPYLMTGNLPIEWDEDGDVERTVEIALRQTAMGETGDILIDGNDVGESYSYKNDAKEGLAKTIKAYYEDNDINPPRGALFGPVQEDAETTEEEERITAEITARQAEAEPNWPVITSALEDNITAMQGETLQNDKLFEDIVKLSKKSGVGIDTPLFADSIWRTTVLRYLIADAVRRGIPGIVYNPGLATSARGGAYFEGVASDRIEWEEQQMTIRGKEQTVWSITSPELSAPIVVSKQFAVPVLGGDVVGYINRQIKGELPSQPERNEETGEIEQKVWTADDFMISRVTNSSYVGVFRRNNNRLVSFSENEEAANAVIAEEVQSANLREDRQAREQQQPYTIRPEQELLVPEGVKRGSVTREAMGGSIRILVGSTTDAYMHTQAFGTLAGARESYESITPKIWNKELKKYGTQVGEIAIKAARPARAESKEGARIVETNARERQITEQHGTLTVQELKGETHGWVVFSEKQGIIDNNLDLTREDAVYRLNNYIENTYGEAGKGIKAFFIPITPQMREKFSGPVPPFHYDPKQDPAMKSAAAKVGYEKTTLLEKFRAMRGEFAAAFNQGVFDRFYGIKRALNRAGSDSTPYISTRLTTSLDSLMKSALFYGHPVWKDGVMSSAGDGLVQVLQPIMSDVELWGMYMAGKRSRRLMLEGLASLSPEQRKLMRSRANLWNGKTEEERIINMMADVLGDPAPTVTRRGFLKGIGASAVSTVPKLPDLKDAPTGIEDIAKRMVQDVIDRRRAYTEWLVGGQTKALEDALDKAFDKEEAPFEKMRELRKKPFDSQTEEDKKFAKAMRRYRELMDEVETKYGGEDAMYDTLEKEAHKKFDKAKVKENIRRDARDRAAADEDLRAAVEEAVSSGREHLFTPGEIRAMTALADKYPSFERVAEGYARFNQKVLDFAQEAGIINPETRPLWENADYVPFYRVEDERMVGPFAAGSGIANQKKPIKRLRGGEAHVGDIVHNIMVNTTNLIDASVKNNAALQAVDALRGSGIVSKKPMTHSQELIPLNQVKKLLLDRGMNPNSIPEDALQGFQKMFAVQPPEGPGVISVLRDGKKEFYYTDDELLYRAMTNINKKQWGQWMNLFRGPKRLLTTLVTLDPGFMAANFVRDTLSAFVISRDTMIPVAAGIKGAGQALIQDEAYRTMVSAGGAFESGYINQYDPRATHKMLKKAMRDPSFVRTVLRTPQKLFEAWKGLGSAIENANRIGVYNAAIRAGKSKQRAVFEAKDLMDFSMGGDWPVIQFLIQTVPFMGARLQGLHRLGRGFAENPIAFSMKGLLVSMAGLALWFAFRDDDRYKELEEWDKDTYFHWWIGDNHYRLPKPFEVGVIFNTAPERIFEYMYSKENDAGRLLMRRWGFSLAETFNFNPIPQTTRPMTEFAFNYNFFTGRSITSPYEADRMAPEEYRYMTSPTMIELARLMPGGLDMASGKIRSPLHLENLYRGYTGTLGRYALMATDAVVRDQMDYPNPPSFRTGDWPVTGRFFRGDDPRRTKYEEEMYRLIRKTTEIQGSLRFLEKTEQEGRFEDIQTEWEPYIRVAKDLESIRQNVSEINKAIMHINLDEDMDPQQKRKEIDALQVEKNMLFELGFQLRPGGAANPILEGEPITQDQIMDLINNFGVDELSAQVMEGKVPETFDLVNGVNTLGARELRRLAGAGDE